MSRRRGSPKSAKPRSSRRQLPNLQWLVGEGCNLDAPLVQLEKNLRAVADSSRIVKLADELAKLRSR